MVTITAPKSSRYQWYVKKNTKKWKKLKGENKRKLTLICNKKMNGYRFKCKLKKKWSKSEKLIITDIGKRYQRSIKPNEVEGMFLPKCADGYCYVYCTNKNFSKEVKKAISIVNKNIGRTFIYTDSPHIADIIIQPWYGNILNDSIWLKENEIDYIKANSDGILGAAFLHKQLFYLICVNYYDLEDMDDYCWAVIIHELGHCIGVKHSTNKKSIMYYTISDNVKMIKEDIQAFKKRRSILKSL